MIFFHFSKLLRFFILLPSLLISTSSLFAEDVSILNENSSLINRLGEWKLLTSSSTLNYSALRYANFLKITPRWPLEKRIEWRYEHALIEEKDETTLKNLCPLRPLKQAQALIICRKFLHNPQNEAQKIWQETIITEADEQDFLKYYGNILTEENQWARFEYLLSVRNKTALNRQIPRLTVQQQILANALFKAKFSPKESFNTFQTLPENVKNTTSLLIAQLHALRITNNLLEAVKFWREYDQHFIKNTPYYQNLWLSERIALARALMYQNGSDINEQQKEALLQLTNVPKFSLTNIQQQDAILLQSYALILYAQMPQKALQNLKPLLSSHIISRKAEAYFLCAEAEKSLHHEESYRNFMEETMKFPTSFYGQFSLALLTNTAFLTSYQRSPLFITKLKEQLSLLPHLSQSSNNLQREDLLQAAKLLTNEGDLSNATLFLSFLVAQTSNTAQLLTINQQAQKLHLPKISILIGRKLSLKGESLYPDAYPLPYDKRLFISSSNILPSGLFEALIKQESSADPDAISPAHAIGLTQILLNTAKQTAHKHHLSFPAPLTITNLTNPSINLTVGQYYLEDLWQHFNSNLMLTLAAYNAGPHRAQTWNFPISQPIAPFNVSETALREKEMQALHWLITLPFSETRTYISHIVTDMNIYALQ